MVTWLHTEQFCEMYGILTMLKYVRQFVLVHVHAHLLRYFWGTLTYYKATVRGYRF